VKRQSTPPGGVAGRLRRIARRSVLGADRCNPAGACTSLRGHPDQHPGVRAPPGHSGWVDHGRTCGGPSPGLSCGSMYLAFRDYRPGVEHITSCTTVGDGGRAGARGRLRPGRPATMTAAVAVRTPPQSRMSGADRPRPAPSADSTLPLNQHPGRHRRGGAAGCGRVRDGQPCRTVRTDTAAARRVSAAIESGRRVGVRCWDAATAERPGRVGGQALAQLLAHIGQETRTTKRTARPVLVRQTPLNTATGRDERPSIRTTPTRPSHQLDAPVAAHPGRVGRRKRQ
jgi:hypothetical protein